MTQAQSPLARPGRSATAFRSLPIRRPNVIASPRADGSVILEQNYPMPMPWPSIPHLFEVRAAEFPEREFIAKRTSLPDGGFGDWRRITFGDAALKARALAQAFLDRDLGPEAGVMVVSGPSIEHGLCMIAAMMAKAPFTPVSTGYSLLSSDFQKLRHVFDLCRPKLIFADDGTLYERALSSLPLDGVEVVTLTPPAALKTSAFTDLLKVEPTQAVDASIAAITPDTFAKTIFTSGSTGAPKGVIQTQRMLTAVIAQHDALYIKDEGDGEAAAYLSWLPWSHVGASNILFGDVINDAATLYIDDGRPTPEFFGETVRNLREISPREYGSTPIFFSNLAAAMENDVSFRDHFFKRLRYLTYSTAGLSQDLFDRLQRLAVEATGQRIPIITKYGSTETQGVTIVSEALEHTGPIGLPFPGITIKLAPVGDKLEIRAIGDTVTPGYLNNPDATLKAFDEEGFYRTGDAARFVDPDRPELGLMFDGRVTENFKLATGTWVSVGPLRLSLIEALAPLVEDCVVAGHDRDHIAILAWPRVSAALELAGAPAGTPWPEVLRSETLKRFVRSRLKRHNAKARGSSMMVRRAVLLSDPPTGEEIAEKGYINQRATLARRDQLVRRLYGTSSDPDIIDVPPA